MENKKLFYLLDQKGQSSVEYLMLVVIIVSMTIAVLKSNAFQDFFGSQGQFATVYKSEIEFSYTNSYQGREAFEEPDYNNPDHSSYKGSSGTRFFGANQEYPAQ